MRASETTMICAFDYAVGRQTYVVGDVATDLILSSEYLTQRGREYIIKEINKRLDENALGGDCDKEQWLKVKKVLEVQCGKN